MRRRCDITQPLDVIFPRGDARRIVGPSIETTPGIRDDPRAHPRFRQKLRPASLRSSRTLGSSITTRGDYSMDAFRFKRYWMPIVTVVAVAFVLAAVVVRGGAVQSLPLPQPMFSDAQLISTGTTPPTEAQCESVGRRCFTPQTVQAAYNIESLYAAGLNGAGQTIAIVDSYGSDTIAHDLH